MPRLKLPPYGKALREERDAGRHPWNVIVNYAERWVHPAKGETTIMLLASEYEPGKYDFSVLAGLPVFLRLHDSGHQAYQREPAMQLMVELATVTAPVVLQWFYEGRAGFESGVGDLFDDFRYREETYKQWPPGWSDQLQHEYERREQRLKEFYSREVAAGRRG